MLPMLPRTIELGPGPPLHIVNRGNWSTSLVGMVAILLIFTTLLLGVINSLWFWFTKRSNPRIERPQIQRKESFLSKPPSPANFSYSSESSLLSGSELSTCNLSWNQKVTKPDLEFATRGGRVKFLPAV